MENTLKSKSALKSKERKPYSQNEAAIGKINKIQSEIPQQYHFDNFHNSPIKKALNEMDAIVKIGVEKDFSLYEKNSMILNSNETIDNLRKNVIHLQMEYEKLDQNFQKEISQRSEISQRLDATKSLVESVLNSSALLGNSIKQLENDKLNLAEFYELVCQTQNKADKKYETVEKLVKEQDILVKTKFDEISKAQEQAFSKNAVSLAESNKSLMHTKEKLKTALSENEKLLLRVEGLTCVTKNLDSSLKSKQKLIRIHQENNFKLQSKIKRFVILKNKYSVSRKNTRKKFLMLKEKNNQLAKHLSETEYSYRNSLVDFENVKAENAEFKLKAEEILKAIETDKQNLEIQNNELLCKITMLESEKAELRRTSTKMTDKINEIDAKYSIEKTNRNDMEEKYNEIVKKNQQLQLVTEELNRENDTKTVIISDLKEQLVNWENNFNSETEFYKNELKNFQNIVDEYKKKISDLEEKISLAESSRQNIIVDFNAKLMDNKKLTDKIENLTNDLLQSTDKIELLKSENSEKSFLITTLETQINTLKSITTDKEKELYQLQQEFENMKLKVSQNNSLQFELDQFKVQNLNLNEKLLKEQSLTLTIKSNFEKQIKLLKEELELEKKLQEESKAIKKKLEKELNEMKKVLEENLKLKDSNKNVKNRLEEAEAKIEAYKVIVKKLESEKSDGEENQSLEISRQKLEITRLEESETANGGLTIMKEASRNYKNNQSSEKEKESTTTRKSKNKKPEPEYLKKDDSKLLYTPSKNITISPQTTSKKVATSTPKSTSNRLISLTPQSTPRKIFTSKSGSQSTPIKKLPVAETPKNIIKDPYNFDSDDSNEILDHNQVLRLFGPRQKSEYDRKPKAKK